MGQKAKLITRTAVVSLLALGIAAALLLVVKLRASVVVAFLFYLAGLVGSLFGVSISYPHH